MPVSIWFMWSLQFHVPNLTPKPIRVIQTIQILKECLDTYFFFTERWYVKSRISSIAFKINHSIYIYHTYAQCTLVQIKTISFWKSQNQSIEIDKSPFVIYIWQTGASENAWFSSLVLIIKPRYLFKAEKKVKNT